MFSLKNQSEKSKKNLDQEYHDLEEKLNDIQAALNRTQNEPKKFETDALSLSDEVQELKAELKIYDEKVRSLNASLMKKDDDIRHHKEIAHDLDTSKKSLEQQLRDTQLRIDEADEFTKRETRRISAKIETQVNFRKYFDHLEI